MNTGFALFSAALVSTLAESPITALILTKTNTQAHPLSISARICMGIMALRGVGAIVLNKLDAKSHTKLGNFAYKLFNEPNAKTPQNNNIDCKA